MTTDLSASIAEQKKNGTAGKFGSKTTSAPTGGLAAPATPQGRPAHINRLGMIARKKHEDARVARQLACRADEMLLSAEIHEVLPDATAFTVIRDRESDTDDTASIYEDVAIEFDDGSYAVFDGLTLSNGREITERQAQSLQMTFDESRFLINDSESNLNYMAAGDHDGHPFNGEEHQWDSMYRLELADAPTTAVDTLERFHAQVDDATRGDLMADAIRERAARFAPNAEKIVFERAFAVDGGDRLHVAGVIQDGAFYDIETADSIRRPDLVWNLDQLHEADRIDDDSISYMADDAGGATNLPNLTPTDDFQEMWELPLR